MVLTFKQQQRVLLALTTPFACSLLLSACYKAVRTTQDVARIPTEYVAATRAMSDCTSEIAAARLDTGFVPTNAAAKLYSAHLITVSQPDYSKASRSIRGKTAVMKLQIDENGDVIPRSIRITGIDDGDFTKELRDVARSFRYFPAVRNGCAVPSWSVAQYTIGEPMSTGSPEFKL